MKQFFISASLLIWPFCSAMVNQSDTAQTHSDPLRRLIGDYSFLSTAHIQSRPGNGPLTLASGKTITPSAPVVMIITHIAKTE